MDSKQVSEYVDRFLDAWNSNDPETVANCYTGDVHYRDPNTRGDLHGGDALRRYLDKLLSIWDMEWQCKESFLFGEEEGGAFLWHAVIRKKGDSEEIELDGMDLIVLRDGKIARNEVYFDRSVLAPLMG